MDEGEEHWVFDVNRSFVAAGDVVYVGDHVGGISSWYCDELSSSIVDNVLRVLFFFLVPFIDLFRNSEPMYCCFSGHFFVLSENEVTVSMRSQ